MSVNHRECLGATKCPFAAECFAERAKERALQSQLIVTNHSLLAIDAIEGVPMIPEYDVVVVDEAHELSAPGDPGRDRRARCPMSSVPPGVRSGTSRAPRPTTSPTPARRCARASTTLRPGRLDELPGGLADALVLVRDSARALVSAFPKESPDSVPDPGRTQARGAVQEVFEDADRMAANSDADVLWLSERDRSRGGAQLCVAPLQVWGPLRDKLLTDKTVVFTSATLMLGGDFMSVATSLGLKPSERVDHSVEPGAGAVEPVESAPDERLPWRGHRRRLAVRLRPARRSCTSPGTCRRPAATASGPRSSTRSSTSSTPPTAARSGCSPAVAPPRPPPSRPVSGCPT